MHDFLHVRSSLSHSLLLCLHPPLLDCLALTRLRAYVLAAQGELSTAPWSKVCVALVSLLVGAAAMSAIGKWA